MKPFSIAVAFSLLLSGCAHYASYDDLGGYGDTSTSYSVGISSGYPAYGPAYYGPMYRPYYVPPGGHRHYHDGHHHHDHDGKKGDRPGGKPRVEGRPPGGRDAKPDRGGGKGNSSPRPQRSRGDR